MTVLRPRVPALIALALTLAAGLGVRAVTDGAFAKYAGVALYATAVYVAVLVVAPRTRIAVVAGLAVAVSWAVELFQLTGVPAELSTGSLLARLVLGSTYSGHDMITYPAGVASAVLVHVAAGARSRSSAPSGGGQRSPEHPFT